MIYFFNLQSIVIFSIIFLKKLESMNENSTLLIQNSQNGLQNFFQVTINSSKLYTLLESHTSRFQLLEDKINGIQNSLTTLNINLKGKIENEKQNCQQNFEIVNQKVEKHFQVHTNSIENFEKQMNSKLKDVDSKIQKLNSQIMKVSDNAKDDLLNHIEKTRIDILGGMQKNIPCIKTVLEIMDEKYNTLNDKISFAVQGFVKQEMDKQKIFFAKRRKSSKLRTQILSRIKFQEESRKQQPPQNKIMYAKGSSPQNNNFITKSLSKSAKKQTYREWEPDEQQKKQNQSQSHFIAVQSEMKDLKEAIENINTKIKIYHKELDFFKQKNIVIDQKVSQLIRKIEKMHHEIIENRNGIKKIESQKMDDKIIQQLRNSIKWINRDFVQRLQKKCTKQQCMKDKYRLQQKISIIYENMLEKADKGSIQKAIIFLESKIKQLVFLVAADQGEQREGAVIKTAFKCLSCDKQVQKNLQNTVQQQRKPQKPARNSFSLRAVTNKMKFRKQNSNLRTKTQPNQGSTEPFFS